MNAPLVRVVKLGGSLFDLTDLPVRVERWLDVQPPARAVMFCGGGAAADRLRRLDHQLDHEDAHSMAIQTMADTARALIARSERVRWIDTIAELPIAWDADQMACLDPAWFIRHDMLASDEPLPASWDVTSDSIAARLAAVLATEFAAAIELVLLKSALPELGARVDDASAADYVDRYFPRAAAGLNAVRCVNLRDDAFPEYDFT